MNFNHVKILFGITVNDIIILTSLTIMLTIFIELVKNGLNTGTISGLRGFGEYSRENQKILFWLFVVSYILFGIFLILALIYFILHLIITRKVFSH